MTKEIIMSTHTVARHAACSSTGAAALWSAVGAALAAAVLATALANNVSPGRSTAMCPLNAATQRRVSTASVRLPQPAQPNCPPSPLV